MMAVKAGPVERLVGAYNAWASNGAATAPPWLKDLRAGAIARFGDLGFPTMKQEAWRFTSVAPIADATFELARPASRKLLPRDIDAYVLSGTATHRLVFVNGFFEPSLSATSGLPAGVRVESLAAALGQSPDLVRQHLAKYSAIQDRPFPALNTAFVRDGAFVHVPARVNVERPIELVFVAVPEQGVPVVTHPRNLVVVDREAQASVVETYAAVGGS